MTETLVTLLNRYLADTAVSFVKLHNLHWNISGADFKQTHEYLESLYDAEAETLDRVAELLRMHGQMPTASLKGYLNLSSIVELESKELSGREALGIVLNDVRQRRGSAVEIRSAASSEDCFDIVNVMEDQIIAFNKIIWFIGEMVK